MRRSEREQRTRRQKVALTKVPQYARDALQVANLFVLPKDLGEWPEGVVMSLSLVVECRERLAQRLDRDPLVGEVAAEFCKMRFAQITADLSRSEAGTSDLGQSDQDPGYSPPTETPDQSNAEEARP